MCLLIETCQHCLKNLFKYVNLLFGIMALSTVIICMHTTKVLSKSEFVETLGKYKFNQLIFSKEFSNME